MSERPGNSVEPKSSGGAMGWMARNSIAVNLAMILLLAGGIWTAFNIQKEVFPEFQLDIVRVEVQYPGASPEEVEQGILLPIEETVKGLQGIKEMTSRAREGSGRVEFELVAGTDRMKAFQDIDQAVNRIRTFPDDIEKPEVYLQSRQRDVMEIGIFGNADIWTLRKLAERLRNELLNHSFITQVEIGNVPDYVTHVEIPQDRLREYNITLGEVADIIEQSSQDVPAGAIETYGGEILLRMRERKQWAEEFGTIPIITSEQGSTITLADMATIEDGFEEEGFHSHYNRSPSVEVSIYRVGAESPLEIEAAVQSVLEAFKHELPPGIEYRIDSNRAEDYGERLDLLLENGILAILIVLFVLALFLELRLAFWVMMGMAISFIGGLIFLPLAGISINMISMFAFLMVLGIVVDDAIVVGENIYEYRQRGLGLMEASIKGVREISVPVIFSILTNIVVFIPFLFVPGTTGKFWKPLPIVVIIIFLVSLFEALFILPCHLAHTGRNRLGFVGERLAQWQESFAERFKRFANRYYGSFLDLCLRYRYVTFCAAVAIWLIVGGFGYSGHMGMIMMPEVSADEIEAGIELPVGTTPRQAAKVAEGVTESTHRMFEKHNLYRAAEGIKTNVRGQNFIDVEIVMKPPNKRRMTANDIIELWRNEIGDIEGVDQITFDAERGPGGWRDDISVDLSHSDIIVLEEASRSFFESVEQFQATRDVNDNYNKGKTQFDFRLLPEGRNLGLTPDDVGRQLRNAFYGAIAKRQLRGINEIEVRVKLPKYEREDQQYLDNYVIRTPAGMEVPLSDVAVMEQGEAFTSINRRDGRRVITVGMDVEPKRATTRVLQSIQQEILPGLRADYPGITWKFQGSQAEMRESIQVLWGGFALALGVIYALLAIAFHSYIQPLIVMTAIPFGIVGALIGHILLGYDLSLISLMGLIALSGVVVNDSLIMVDYANRHREGLAPIDAIHQAGIRRFRPIVLTTLTTFGGLTPIILETSRQAAYLIPMAISLGFGIIFATAIILVLVPCLYMIFEDIRGVTNVR